MIDESTHKVITGLSELIFRTLQQHGAEYTQPVRAADQMDEFISRTKDRVAQLMRIRNEFEAVMAAPLERYDG